MPANATTAATRPQLTLSGPGGELPLDRPTIEALAELFVALLNITEPDTDLEEVDEAEPEELDAAWVEWDQIRGSQKGGPNIMGDHEDDEEDSEDCDGFENEPAFDRTSLKRLRSRYGDGPSCLVSDSDRDDGEV